MKRNMFKIIEDTKSEVNEHYTITSDEWTALTDIAQKKPGTAVWEAFVYGYAMGERALKAKQKKTKALPARQH